MIRLPKSNVAVLPLGAGILGAVLTLGTLLGQSGHAAGYLDISAAGSGGSSMPGMAMPGMKMPGMSMPAGSSTGGSSAGMNMPASAPMPKMDMSDPKMAAAMPGGLHATCQADACTVIFADGATGIAKVLGTTARLDRVQGKDLTLTVGGHKLTLSRHKPVTVGKIRIELTDQKAHEFTVRFSRTHRHSS